MKVAGYSGTPKDSSGSRISHGRGACKVATLLFTKFSEKPSQNVQTFSPPVMSKKIMKLKKVLSTELSFPEIKNKLNLSNLTIIILLKHSKTLKFQTSKKVERQV